MALAWHFAFGNGRGFVRENGSWGDFMMAYPAVRDAAELEYKNAARRAWKTGKPSGAYAFSRTVFLNRSLWLTDVLNGVTYRAYGRYIVDHHQCSVTLVRGKNVIFDIADTHGIMDGVVFLLSVYGNADYPDWVKLCLSTRPFQFFAVELKWDMPQDLVFKVEGGGTDVSVAPLQDAWPYK